MTTGEVFGTWLAAGLTLMMFSFIYKDNPLFKFGEHLYLGVSLGYFMVTQYWNSLYPDVYSRISIDHNYWVIFPTLLGFFILLRLVPSLGWLSRWSFAFFVGGSAGFAIPSVIHGQLLPQLYRTMVPFGDKAPQVINQVLILTGVLTVLTFFFFSVEHKKFVGGMSKVGLFFLMVSFGASFGNTVMARVSLLIGRLQFLHDDWWKVVLQALHRGG
jgi:hypothetical protein